MHLRYLATVRRAMSIPSLLRIAAIASSLSATSSSSAAISVPIRRCTSKADTTPSPRPSAREKKVSSGTTLPPPSATCRKWPGQASRGECQAWRPLRREFRAGCGHGRPERTRIAGGQGGGRWPAASRPASAARRSGCAPATAIRPVHPRPRRRPPFRAQWRLAAARRGSDGRSGGRPGPVRRIFREYGLREAPLPGRWVPATGCAKAGRGVPVPAGPDPACAPAGANCLRQRRPVLPWPHGQCPARCPHRSASAPGIPPDRAPRHPGGSQRCTAFSPAKSQSTGTSRSSAISSSVASR